MSACRLGSGAVAALQGPRSHPITSTGLGLCLALWVDLLAPGLWAPSWHILLLLLLVAALYSVLTVQCAHCTVCSLYSVLTVQCARALGRTSRAEKGRLELKKNFAAPVAPLPGVVDPWSQFLRTWYRPFDPRSQFYVLSQFSRTFPALVLPLAMRGAWYNFSAYVSRGQSTHAAPARASTPTQRTARPNLPGNTRTHL